MKTTLLVLLFCIAGSSLAVPVVHKVPVEVSRSISRGMRIVNGWTVENRGDIPYQVRILAPVEGGYIVCGATLITNDHVLTAAHCTWNLGHFILAFGIIDWNEPAETIDSYTKREHPGYNGQSLDHDISLLYLSRRIEFSGWIGPAQLPSRGQQGNTFVGAQVMPSGFGADTSGNLATKLQAVNMRVITNSDCASVFGRIEEFVICCRGWDHGGQSTCGGDSGGPLVLTDGSRTQVGVVSFGSSRGCDAGDPAGFTRVTWYLDWISENTGIGIRP